MKKRRFLQRFRKISDIKDLITEVFNLPITVMAETMVENKVCSTRGEKARPGAWFGFTGGLW